MRGLKETTLILALLLVLQIRTFATQENVVNETLAVPSPNLEKQEVLLTKANYSLYIAPSPMPTLMPARLPAAKLQVINKEVNSSSNETDSLITAVNKWRTARGLNKVSQYDPLCNLVNIRINELSSRGEMDNHNGFRKYLTKHSLTSMGINYIAENLAQGSSEPDEIVKMWEDSTPHREQLLAKTEINKGCGAIRGNISVLVGGY